ncbi:MAG: DUF3987 domain-containing protein [Paludibacteraceae bacterium]|nr:DUF3987 domain-containing protein [Paludibacteraceae bacterium]
MNNSFSVPSEDLYLTTNIPEGGLPEFLTRAISVADEPSQQDMLLIGTLTAASYALPHVRILHGMPQHSYYPNLMSLVVAPPAAGKGVLNYIHRLMAPIQDKLRRLGMTAIIPANSSSAAFLDLLALNFGAGLMVETEMDVLSQIWKNDYGNYSYLFRQAFEHEAIRRARKAGGGKLSYTEIPSPRLSAVLSGTPNQLKPLLVSRENGLASRFIPYIVEEITPFDRRALRNGDHLEANGALAVFDELGQELRQRWEWLSKQNRDILWSLTDEQSEQLGDLFDDGYRIALEEMNLPTCFDATVKRLAVTIKRIGAILTLLRQETPTTAENQESMIQLISPISPISPNLPSVLYCSDEDFHTLMMLAEKLMRHAALMTLMLPDETESALPAQIKSEAENRAEQLLDTLGEKFTTADALKAGEQMGLERRTIEQYLTSLKDNKQIIRTKKGNYQKVQ